MRTRRLLPPPFGPGMSAQEALRDREKRHEVMERGVFACYVTEDHDERYDPVDQRCEGGMGGFQFRIGAEGVGIVEPNAVPANISP